MDAGDNIIMLKREILNIKHTKEKSRTRYIRKWREERGWFRVVDGKSLLLSSHDRLCPLYMYLNRDLILYVIGHSTSPSNSSLSSQEKKNKT